ncbi:beta-fructofuranosidase [Gracilibacillus halophilus YIM-C55.5]|uniref:Sucrose-6-phosphate hydrolase n=1 Tax=Gracilibacillus halophilus YIM-C55.5 TaxID=1308866 RepID=N4WBM8_9BACI|nr:sucrose-6-phosphate hydrolase [Gracilibacillus halophilus]ENH96654.1 beta-fructofuranosidase [Gracilibacillus halophilus YIM-C55.5]
MNQDEYLKQKAEEYRKKHQEQVKNDPYYPQYHIASPVGLLNDPNGWIQWNGTYHLFFQWMPFDTAHGAKFWGHVRSENLVDWQLEAPALTPSSWYDKDGCYSGSAIVHEGKLYLFYTGNVKNDEVREAYQCLATSTDGQVFHKQGVQIEVPDGYTAHFRDPKVWKEGTKWYMVIGAQTDQEKGSVVWYESEDLNDWTFRGELSSGFGYMWECPDYFQLDGKDILLFSPQGLSASGIDYQNTYQSGYVIGEWKDDFTHGPFVELDRGFDFYAPQTTKDEHGRRLLFGWMGMADDNEPHHPTISNQWIHQLTIPRELVREGDRLYQKPVPELKELRETKEEHTFYDNWNGPIPRVSEWYFEVSKEKDIHMSIFRYATMEYNASEKSIRFTRPRLDNGEIEERIGMLNEPLHSLHCYLDHSSIELFVNGGALTFSARMFPDPNEETFEVKGSGTLSIWSLRKSVGGGD